MNIAYIVPSLANKGPVLVVKDLVSVMTEHGHNCTVFYFDDKNEHTFNCNTIRISFFQKINFNEYDVVHSHGIRPDSYIWYHRSNKYKTLFVSTLHSFLFEDLASEYNKFISLLFGNLWLRVILNRHDSIAVLSNLAKQYYSKILPSEKLYIAYNSRIINKNNILSLREEDEIKSFKYKDSNSILLGVNAFLSPIKGIDILIKAMTFLEEKYKLYIVGSGKSYNYLLNMAKKYDVEHRIFFAGYRKDAYRYLPYYDIYMMTSYSEGFPLALLEASSFSLPSVCSNIPIFRELFSDDEVSFFDLDNIDSLVNAIKNATNNVDMAKRMNRKYIENYSPEHFYLNYLQIYSNKKN